MKRKLASLLCAFSTSLITGKSALEYNRYFTATYNQYRNKLDTAHEWYDKLLRHTMPLYAYKGYLELLFTQGKNHDIAMLIPQLEGILSTNPDMQRICAHALAHTGKLKQADDLLLRAAQQHKTHQEIIFYAAQTYIRRKEPENALTIINTLLNSTPRIPSHYAFYFLKSQIYTALNQIDNAIESIQKSIAINPTFHKGRLILAVLQEKKGNIQPSSHTRTLQLLAAQHKYEEVFHLLQTWIIKEPDNQVWYEYLRQLSERFDPQKIIDFLGNQSNLHSSNTLLQTKFALYQARIYYQHKEYEKMISVLEKGYALDQQYAPLLNMLAYSYAKQNKHLKKATQLITQALKQESHNPYYLDTKAFILYVQGDYTHAQTILEPLIKQVPTDTTILSHLSKVLYKQGMLEHAKTIVQQAYSLAKTSSEKQKWKKRLNGLHH